MISNADCAGVNQALVDTTADSNTGMIGEQMIKISLMNFLHQRELWTRKSKTSQFMTWVFLPLFRKIWKIHSFHFFVDSMSKGLVWMLVKEIQKCCLYFSVRTLIDCMIEVADYSHSKNHFQHKSQTKIGHTPHSELSKNSSKFSSYLNFQFVGPNFPSFFSQNKQERNGCKENLPPNITGLIDSEKFLEQFNEVTQSVHHGAHAEQSLFNFGLTGLSS